MAMTPHPGIQESHVTTKPLTASILLQDHLSFELTLIWTMDRFGNWLVGQTQVVGGLVMGRHRPGLRLMKHHASLYRAPQVIEPLTSNCMSL